MCEEEERSAGSSLNFLCIDRRKTAGFTLPLADAAADILCWIFREFGSILECSVAKHEEAQGGWESEKCP